MRPLAPSVARRRSRRIHRGGRRFGMANAECRRPEDGWGGALWSIGGGYSPSQKIDVFTPISAAEPIDQIGDPSGEVPMGSLLI